MGRIVDVLSNILTVKLFTRRHHEKSVSHRIFEENGAVERRVTKAY